MRKEKSARWKGRSFGTQFRLTLVSILLCTLAASLLTYVVLFAVYACSQASETLYPANYYEQRAEKAAQYLAEIENMEDITKERMDSIVQGRDFFYQVTDGSGNILWGTYDASVFDSEKDMHQKINTTFRLSGYYARTVPVIDGDGRIDGAVTFIYTLSFVKVNHDREWLQTTIVIALSAPFVYMIVFCILFSGKFARNIAKPLRILADAAGQIKNQNLNFAIEYDGQNELGELCRAFTDMQKELKDSLAVQWKLEQERLETTDALAHDLKSPLSVIKAYTETLLDDTTVDEEQKQYLLVIEENVQKSTAMVQQMQYISELTIENVQIETTWLDPAEFLQKKTEEYTQRARTRHLCVSLQMEDCLPSVVGVDVGKLERILDNLVSNSMEYTPAGGKITISVKCESCFLHYFVMDTGKGFSPKDKEKAFERFYRGDEARSTKGGHSGQGLYIVRKLSELLGGSAEIMDTDGGACVHFWHQYHEREK